jgi:hypothetical protein
MLRKKKEKNSVLSQQEKPAEIAKTKKINHNKSIKTKPTNKNAKIKKRSESKRPKKFNLRKFEKSWFDKLWGLYTEIKDLKNNAAIIKKFVEIFSFVQNKIPEIINSIKKFYAKNLEAKLHLIIMLLLKLKVKSNKKKSSSNKQYEKLCDLLFWQTYFPLQMFLSYMEHKNNAKKKINKRPNGKLRDVLQEMIFLLPNDNYLQDVKFRNKLKELRTFLCKDFNNKNTMIYPFLHTTNSNKFLSQVNNLIIRAYNLQIIINKKINEQINNLECNDLKSTFIDYPGAKKLIVGLKINNNVNASKIYALLAELKLYNSNYKNKPKLIIQEMPDHFVVGFEIEKIVKPKTINKKSANKNMKKKPQYKNKKTFYDELCNKPDIKFFITENKEGKKDLYMINTM